MSDLTPAGKPCSYDVDCLSGYCSVAEHKCAEPWGLHSFCNFDPKNSCPDGLNCSPYSSTCVQQNYTRPSNSTFCNSQSDCIAAKFCLVGNKSCLDRKRIGEECIVIDKLYQLDNCHDGFVCKSGTASSKLTCHKRCLPEKEHFCGPNNVCKDFICIAKERTQGGHVYFAKSAAIIAIFGLLLTLLLVILVTIYNHKKKKQSQKQPPVTVTLETKQVDDVFIQTPSSPPQYTNIYPPAVPPALSTKPE